MWWQTFATKHIPDIVGDIVNGYECLREHNGISLEHNDNVGGHNHTNL